MRQFPAFFNMDNAHVVVFGGGVAALNKVRLLAKTNARITVVVDEIDPEFMEQFAGRITIAPLNASGPALDTARFAIIANRVEANANQAIQLARQYGVPINVVDRPSECDFTVPSILDRGEIVAAVGSNGSAPVLAKSIRRHLEVLVPKRAGQLALMARRWRPKVKAAFTEHPMRRLFWEEALNGSPAALVYAGKMEAAEAEMQRILDAHVSGGTPRGIVHLVGAGPGDPELLTMKALRILQEADIVFFDRLVSPEIVDLIRRDAERMSVGKSKGNHSVAQTEIHRLVIEAAQAGKRVVRLKGGDPFIFARGGEELAAVRDAGVEVEVVPGISSALGCAASAGIPLTHRDHAQTLTFVTGHAKSGETPNLDWEALAKPRQTVTVFMGVGTSAAIAEELINAGCSPETPVAVIENGTRDNEVKIFGLLAQLPNLIKEAGIAGPALLIIGEVAALGADAKVTTQAEEANS